MNEELKKAVALVQRAKHEDHPSELATLREMARNINIYELEHCVDGFQIEVDEAISDKHTAIEGWGRSQELNKMLLAVIDKLEATHPAPPEQKP